MHKERPFFPETEDIPPVPNTLDLIIIDGKFAQCISKTSNINMGVTITFIEDKNLITIPPEEWVKYKYKAPARNMLSASDLVRNGIMNEKQLQKVHWGPEQKEYPHLKGEVTFFGTYTKEA